MRTPLFILFGAASLLGCATTGEGGLPVHAPPFSSDTQVIRPTAEMGELDVEAFLPSPTSKAHKPNGPWRLFDREGRPLSPVLRENENMAVPVGYYVVMGRDPEGHVHLAQVQVDAGEVTHVSLPTQSVPVDSSYETTQLEE
jgi:hypothetical protein